MSYRLYITFTDRPTNQQCHINSARAWMGGPSIKARSEQSDSDVYRIISNLVEIPVGQYLNAMGSLFESVHDQ